MESDEQLRSKTGRQLDDDHCQLVTCCVDELHPHPSYVRHHLTVPASKLSALAERGDLAFREPIVITQDRAIVDGYARCELARLQGRPALPCIEYQLTEDEALHWILQRHRRSNGLNDFCRILLGLEIEPWFKEQARSNQRTGGEKKGSSKLTEAQRLDVRAEIAAAASVSLGNVTKVKQLMVTAHPKLLAALRSGEIRIHRAWQWSKLPTEEQLKAFIAYQSQRGIKKTIRALVSRHRSKGSLPIPDLGNLVRRLSALETAKHGPLDIALIKALWRAALLTEELFRSPGSPEESLITCVTNSL